MLQLDRMDDSGKVETTDIMDESYWIAMRMYRNDIAFQEYQLVYLWLVNEDELGDQVILERWVRQ